MERKSGRSSSQISIYDYPEHLNPFYEDDQHKRLRFWHIGNNNNGKNKTKTGRSNSFSIDGIRDMWSFKSFRLRKKSSTLGINKTSESPPPLRRHYLDVNTSKTNYGTLDSRHTVTLGLTNNTNNNNVSDNLHFQRNTNYRSSLHDMNKMTVNEDTTFLRNNRYRNTMQSSKKDHAPPPPTNRYVYGGSVTPNLNGQNTMRGMTPGSSQTSLNSTNPFEDDDSISYCTDASQMGITSTPIKRPARKKRRAPPPPTQPIVIPQIITTNLEDTAKCIELRIHEDNSPIILNDSNAEAVQIHSLTAEIESFVKQANDNGNSCDNDKQLVIERLSGDGIDSSKTEQQQQKIIKVKVNLLNEANENQTVIQNEQLKENLEYRKTAIEKDIQAPIPIFVEEKNADTVKHERPHTPISSEVDDILDDPSTTTPIASNVTLNELRITESTDNIIEKIPATTIKTDNYEFKVRYVPLKGSFDEDAQTNDTLLYSSNENVVERDHSSNPLINTGRRRSVKEIIDSINRSQSLLKINRDKTLATDTPTQSQSTESITRNIEKINESQREIEKMLKDISSPGSECDNDLNNIPIMVLEKFEQFSNTKTGEGNKGSPEIPNSCVKQQQPTFDKCILRRDKIDNDVSLRTDWNPLPKPRRSRNLSAELGQTEPS